MLEAVESGVLGLQVDATAPVTATVRSYAAGDLAHAVGGATLEESATLVAPVGEKKLLLAGATSVGVATLTARSMSGKRLSSQRIELQPGRGATVKVPRNAVVVSLLVERSMVTAALLVSGRGAVVAPFVERVRNGLVPQVRPGRP